MKHKVLVFTVTYDKKDYCFEQFVKQFPLNYNNYRHVWIDNTDDDGEYARKLESYGLEVIKVRRGNNAREALARSQNIARKIVLDEGYDYALSIESDMLNIPKNVIQTLIGRAKDVVGCFYTIGDDKIRKPCITVADKKANGLIGTRVLSMEEGREILKTNGLHGVNSCGLGCTLIKREVLEKVRFMYYPHLKPFSDVFFANDVWKKGFKIYVDSSIYLNHDNYFCSAHVEDR